MNWLKNCSKKFTRFLRREDDWQRISTSITQINLNTQIKPSFPAPDFYAEQLFQQKAQILEKSLLQAKDQAKMINKATSEAENHPQQIEEAIKEIIRNCNAISLSGIQILAGEAIHLKYNQQELVIKLPAYSKEILETAEKHGHLPEINQKAQELENAINSSLDDLQKFLVEIETSQQNCLSAGIDLKLLQRRIDC